MTLATSDCALAQNEHVTAGAPRPRSESVGGIQHAGGADRIDGGPHARVVFAQHRSQLTGAMTGLLGSYQQSAADAQQIATRDSQTRSSVLAAETAAQQNATAVCQQAGYASSACSQRSALRLVRLRLEETPSRPQAFRTLNRLWSTSPLRRSTSGRLAPLS
jgi:hypothetical protein